MIEITPKVQLGVVLIHTPHVFLYNKSVFKVSFCSNHYHHMPSLYN